MSYNIAGKAIKRDRHDPHHHRHCRGGVERRREEGGRAPCAGCPGHDDRHWLQGGGRVMTDIDRSIRSFVEAAEKDAKH